MPSFDTYVQSLAHEDRRELESLMLAVSISHATICAAASEDQDPHASPETMAARISEMSTEQIARALAPFAAIFDMVHEQHHEAEHGH